MIHFTILWLINGISATSLSRLDRFPFKRARNPIGAGRYGAGASRASPESEVTLLYLYNALMQECAPSFQPARARVRSFGIRHDCHFLIHRKKKQRESAYS